MEIEGNHVIVIYHQLFSSQRIEIAIPDIYNVEVDSVLEFAELIIYSKMFVDNTIKIPKLWKWEAEKFQSVINEMRQKEHQNEIPVFTK